MYPFSGLAGRQRGQSGPIGLVLVFALVIAATTLIVALGASTIGGTQESLDTARTEKAMTQLDSQAALVALGNSNVQRVDFSTGRESTYTVNDDAGRMTLSYTNQTTGAETTVFSEELGSVVYGEDTDTTIAYQGGGVWRSDGGDSAVMISPPEFHYRDATLTLPLVTVGSEGTIGNRARITRSNTTRFFPNATRNSAYQNPLENARVEVSVTSQYYQAWGRFFEERTDGRVEYDHANDRVTLMLVTPLQNTRITAATASLSASGSFEINGNAGNICNPNKVYVNSYNSSLPGDYCSQTTGQEGDIVYGGDVDLSDGSGNSDIYGDVVSGGSVDVGSGGGQPLVHGNINYTDGCDDCDGQIAAGTGDDYRISGIEQAPAINGIIRTQVNESRTDHDNGDTSAIDGTTIDYSSGTPELTDGSYYLSTLQVGNSDTLTLNTDGGNIFIAVEENVDLADDARIEVTGDGVVYVYVLGTGGNAEQFSMGSNSEITNAGDDAEQFRVFGQDNFTATLGGGAVAGGLSKYVGVIYAPPGTGGTGAVTLNKGVVYGGILTGTTTIQNGGSIHYDEALRRERVLEQSESIVRVTYIHASTNEVQIEND